MNSAPSTPQSSELAAAPSQTKIRRPLKKNNKQVQLNFRVPETDRKALEAAAARRDCNLSTLLAGAVSRCLRDDTWSTRVRGSVTRNKIITPPPELVDISNAFLAFEHVLERMMATCNDTDVLNDASLVYLDAQVKLKALRATWGC